MLAEQGDELGAEVAQRAEELRYIELQLEKARRKEAAWTARRQMLEESAARRREELERLA